MNRWRFLIGSLPVAGPFDVPTASSDSLALPLVSALLLLITAGTYSSSPRRLV